MSEFMAANLGVPGAQSGFSPPLGAPRATLTTQQWGMLSFLLSEVAFFGTLIAAYVTFLGQDQSGPTPAVLSLPLVIGTTICLLSSSGTIHVAESRLRAGARGQFLLWWAATIVLGVTFLAGTAFEWHDLITERGLTISRNLFGTTYYSLVGLHAFHVTVGLLALAFVSILGALGLVKQAHTERLEVLSLYWHFVDAVWVIVFTVVYVIGR